ncbi:TPA_asm: hypothetical protein GD653_04755 [Campylobacter jejuni]|uniref:hypothetical protein n=1 Tax=Campylobacter TaxID=194 RepID=UPI000FB7416C|nr:hypothetical protein [Campylobacter jejuni]EAI7420654.1 hypothetical protein [Campylobacter hyointestinalis]EAJ1483983.1 hypothetical protein [Campylobacter coli]EAI0825630.1 hypothetical protein [Campylobacter jejuni]EAI0862078.1 hypothetical protein [Campylobacter jejuni]
MYFLSTEPLASDRNEMQMSILLNMLASFMGVKSTNEDFLLCSHLKHTKQNTNENQKIDIKKLQNDFLSLLG